MPLLEFRDENITVGLHFGVLQQFIASHCRSDGHPEAERAPQAIAECFNYVHEEEEAPEPEPKPKSRRRTIERRETPLRIENETQMDIESIISEEAEAEDEAEDPYQEQEELASRVREEQKRMRRWTAEEDAEILDHLKRGENDPEVVMIAINTISPENPRTISAVRQLIWKLQGVKCQ